jgi:hypothetical protein
MQSRKGRKGKRKGLACAIPFFEATGGRGKAPAGENARRNFLGFLNRSAFIPLKVRRKSAKKIR